ncbi:ras guanine nucleotide exchange factor domain-containing protein [Fimicolochytrium jonesii]|uniref:ras guanine nucleotide exchange factor domain-containing protein n=1 Tax=Fimicolochytrium jonesii TaxID=1396493 RepID=UPI0022FDF8B9|nr:ras guanine nucleotide exchange factor domain-containing protein [Fimicolochytrium jonesii]KAI8824055.1 ras guanine nucleotide exchange factor domain-containing protein [Fimicolochytrium jonesii]
MRLKLQETLDALRDSMKSGPKEGPKIPLTSASEVHSKSKRARNSLSPATTETDHVDEGLPETPLVSSIQSSRQATMERPREMANPDGSPPEETIEVDDSDDSQDASAEEEGSDGNSADPSQMRRLATEHKSSHKLYSNKTSRSVPEIAISDREVVEKETEMGILGSNEGKDSVAELGNILQRRESGIAAVGTGGMNGGVAGPVVPWKGATPGTEANPAPLRQRRSSAGLFFKPGFSKTEAWQGLGEAPGETPRGDGTTTGNKRHSDSEKARSPLSASDEHLDDRSPRPSTTHNLSPPSEQRSGEEEQQPRQSKAASDRPYSFMPGSDASFQMPSMMQIDLDDFPETTTKDAASRRPEERSLPIRLSRSLRVSVARKSVTGASSYGASNVGSQDSLSLNKSYSTLSVQSGPRHSSVASLLARRQDVPSIGHFVVKAQQRQALEKTVNEELLASLGVRDEESWTIESTGVVQPHVDLRPKFLSSHSMLTTENINGKLTVVSGRLPDLVQVLASEGTTDAEYIVDFLTTYRYFADPVDVARLLIMRYVTVGGDPPISAESETEAEEEGTNVSESLADFLSYLKKADPVKKSTETNPRKLSKSGSSSSEDWGRLLQLKILNVFKKWIDLYPLDFDQTRELYLLTVLFLQKHVETQPTRSVFASSMLQNLHEKLDAYRAHEPMPLSPSQLLVPAYQAAISPVLPSPGRALTHGVSEPSLASLSVRRGSVEGSTGTSLGDFVTARTSRLPGGAPTLGRASSSLTLDTTIRSKRRSSNAAHGISSPPADGPLTPSLGIAISLDTFSPKSASHARASTSPANLEASQVSMPNISDTYHVRHAGLESPGPGTTTDLSADALAQQLTLMEHGYFSRIQMSELFFQSWNDKQMKHVLAPNLIALITWFNRIAYGVATQVVSQPLLRSRVTCIKRFIYIAQLCFSWGNFNTLFEVVAGLNLGPVTRLKRTWKALPKKYWDVWNQLNLIVSNENSYKTYRAALRSLQTTSHPILPYLGVNLSDLTFAEDGNPSFLSTPSSAIAGGKTSAPVINFTKFQLISSLIRSIVGLQARGSYAFPPDMKLQAFLIQEWPVLDDAELYEYSKVAEPKQLG